MLAPRAMILVPALFAPPRDPIRRDVLKLFAHHAKDLRSIADAARSSGVLALDTEFMRERTYYARLCLMQVGVGGEAWIVDPLEVSDLGPLLEVMADRDVLKVLHAGGQDLEILTRMAGTPPVPVFDTQVAATLAGFPSQVGYARLVKDLFDVDLDKSDTYTDWSRRPLTPAQIEYALSDVRYLPEIHAELTERLTRAGRMSWLKADFERLSDPATYDDVPEQQFRRIKRASSLSRRQLGVLQGVAAWREREARRRDLPRRWVVGDETLIEVARRQPTTVEDLTAVRGFNLRSTGDGGRGLLEAVREGRERPESELPRMAKRPRTIVDIEGVVELMGALVRVRASEHGIAVPLLATRADLERLASGEREECALLEGWRKELVGDDLVDLVEGHVTLRVAGGKVVPERISG
jgi:ribonuclease D